MARDIVRLSNLSNVSAGGTATLDVPVGLLAYHQIRLNYDTGAAGGPTRAQMESDIGLIRLNINGKAQREFTAAELFAINAYHGVPVHDGSLPIFLAEPWRRSMQGEDGLAWRVGDVDTFHVEIDIAETANAPKIEARAVTDIVPVEDAAMGEIVKWKRLNIDNSAIGVKNFTQFSKEDAYYAFHCFSPSIDNVRVETDRIVRWDQTAQQMKEYLEDQGFNPQADMYHVDFAATARVLDMLHMKYSEALRVGTFLADFKMTAANGFPVLTETVGPRD